MGCRNIQGGGLTKIESIKAVSSSSNGFKTINSMQVNQGHPQKQATNMTQNQNFS